MECNRRALEVLEKNIRICGFIEKSQIIGTIVAKGLRILGKRGHRFDFIFLDPPYGMGVLRDTLIEISQSEILKDSTLVVAEHASSELVEENIEKLTLNDRRSYGKTSISFFTAWE